MPNSLSFAGCNRRLGYGLQKFDGMAGWVAGPPQGCRSNGDQMARKPTMSWVRGFTRHLEEGHVLRMKIH